MAVNIAIPIISSRFLDQNQNVSRDWYLFLSTLLQLVGGPAVAPGGGGVTPGDVAEQFEEYPLSVPDAQEALRGVDELRNQFSSLLSSNTELRNLLWEVSSRLEQLAPVDLRTKVDQLELAFESGRPFGQTAIPEGFTAPTLLNSWINFGGVAQTAGFTRAQDGTIRLRGLLKSGTIGSSMFTLPLGYRPSAQELIATISADAIGRIDITTAGDVIPSVGTNSYVSLGGITFRAA